MANTACVTKNIVLVTIMNGSKYLGPIDSDGNEVGDVQMVTTDEADKREYYCLNCKKTWDGSETFEEVKKHLGTFPLTD